MEGGGRCGAKEARPRADHTRSAFQTARGGGRGLPDWLVRKAAGLKTPRPS